MKSKARRLAGLKLKMQERGTTPAKVAFALGIQRKNLYAFAAGTYAPSGNTLLRLCEILDCDIRELINPPTVANVSIHTV